MPAKLLSANADADTCKCFSLPVDSPQLFNHIDNTDLASKIPTTGNDNRNLTLMLQFDDKCENKIMYMTTDSVLVPLHYAFRLRDQYVCRTSRACEHIYHAISANVYNKFC